jgi:ubiquinone/menaquinone biosynthesis C-methylase UbiE
MFIYLCAYEMEMSELFLNQDLEFKKKETFSYVYNNRTGWFFPGGEWLWKFLESFRYGRKIVAQERNSDPMLEKLLHELMKHRYLLSEMGTEFREYLDFYPTRTLYTVFYRHDIGTDVAIQRKGRHGEVDYDIVTLKGLSKALWDLCDGSKKLRDIINILTEKTEESYAITKSRVFGLMKDWTSLSMQIIRMLPEPLSNYSVVPSQLLVPAPFLPSLKAPASRKAKDVRKYYIKGITDAYRQFESVESTLSHIYRIPHPILDGKSYGEALLLRILEMKSIEMGCRILEIGGGYGDISKDILEGLSKEKPELSHRLTYIVYDLSPELIYSQRRLHEKAGTHVEHILGDAQNLAVANASVDIALSNEAIADFATPEMTIREVNEIPKKYGIPLTRQFMDSLTNAPERFRLNLGAFRLLKEIERVLKPGGLAIITEYGYQDKLPSRAEHLDHEEYSIHFGHMVAVANALGLKVEITDAFRFLGFRTDVELITHPSFQAAFRILEHNGIHLPNIVYTKELFYEQLGERADFFENIQFVKCRKEPIEIVKVLICTKPAPT